MEGAGRMEAETALDAAAEVEAGIVTKWIERYYEEKLGKKEKRDGEGRMARNPFIAQMAQLN